MNFQEGNTDNTFGLIANKLKRLRKEKSLTLQDLGDKTGYTKAYISKVENRRAIPSLPSLITILKALGEDLNTFFEDITEQKITPYILIKKEKYKAFEKEEATGYHYESILSNSFSNINLDFVMLRLEPNATRELVVTEGYQFIITLKGTLYFQLDQDIVKMEEEDSLFFHGRIPHKPLNNTQEDIKLLVIYFLNAINTEK